jgi:hypothetical protein
MAVFSSARKSTTSAFNLITDIVEVGSSAVTQLSRSVDMLDEKTQTLHADVRYNEAAKRLNLKEKAADNAAAERAEHKAEIQKRIDSDKEFAKHFKTAHDEITKALKDL